MLPTQCRICGERDSPAHLLQHARLDGPPAIPEELVQFLVTLAGAADVINPHLSTPCLPEPSMELELELEPSSSDEQDDDIDSLSFEGDIAEAIL